MPPAKSIRSTQRQAGPNLAQSDTFDSFVRTLGAGSAGLSLIIPRHSREMTKAQVFLWPSHRNCGDSCRLVVEIYDFFPILAPDWICTGARYLPSQSWTRKRLNEDSESSCVCG